MSNQNQPKPPAVPPPVALAKKLKASVATIPVRETLVVTGALVIFVVAVILAASSLGSFVEEKSEKALVHARHFDGLDTSATITPPNDISPSEQEIVKRLVDHLDGVRGFAHYHVTAAQTFFVSQYKAITIATFAAVIAGLLLVPISWTGWKDAKLILTVPFFLAAGTAILFTTYSKIYKQQENITTNLTSYFAYLTLEDEILSYYPRLVAQRGVKDAQVDREPHVFLEYVEGRLDDMRTLGVSLDPSSVPEFQKVFKEVSEAQGDGV